jgi:uncharacterized membrane protein YebE (DUF533 family)
LDPKLLLEQLLGGQVAGNLQNMGQQAQRNLNQAGGTQAFAGGALAGGVLGLLLGNKKVRKKVSKLTGGVLGYGGAAALGALAHRAYQDYSSGKSVQAAGPATSNEVAEVAPADLPHARPAADGTSFELILIRGMIAAAKADGHVDADEQSRLFGEVERLGLGAEEKAYVFDALSRSDDLHTLAAAPANQEQAAELYLASRLAIDPDQAVERVYLDALAARLKLPSELRAHLDAKAGD